MNEFTKFPNSFAEAFSSLTMKTAEGTEGKGRVFAIILHVLLGLYLISALRAIFTNPGTIPEVTISQ